MIKYIKLLFIFIGFGIMGFLSMEFIFHLKPCKLCTFQRLPFYFGLLLCILGFIKPLFARQIIILIIFLFGANICIAIFHFLVEEGVFSFECISGSANTIEEIRRLMQSQPSCSDKAYFMGMRITLLSFAYSLFILLLGVFILSKKR